ncbi:Rv3235 family protein [Cryobacterium sp. Y50]|uniref:Rv3235 family protein n=1 Tax=Cryobacterium sp. Y50 TaxID=2048286 RepID=UPI000CE324B9|nr:Rv3235 family protein [Cryobacterium sp. Y50]
MPSPGSSESNAQALRRERSEDDEFFGPQPSTRAELPDPEPLLRALAICAFEVIAGVRQIEHLASWVTDDVYAHLRIRASIAARARAITGQVADRPRLAIGHVTQVKRDNGGLDAVVVVFEQHRSYAVAICLKGMDRRWRASVLVVL